MEKYLMLLNTLLIYLELYLSYRLSKVEEKVGKSQIIIRIGWIIVICIPVICLILLYFLYYRDVTSFIF